jgi:hypothetical protein
MQAPAMFLLVIGLAGCAGVPATPEQRQVAEQRLLAPYLRDTEVGCTELLVELTGNFHVNVGQPAIDVQAHAARKERGDGYLDTIWTNKLGDPKSAFTVTIGEPEEISESGIVRRPRTKFTVLNEVRLRVFSGTHPLALNAHAGGSFVVVREASVKMARDLKEYVVEDGALRIR